MAFAEPLNQMALDMQSYMQLHQLQFYLNRIATNLGLTAVAPNSQLLTVVGANLFQLAAIYYGDATQWALIANANGLVDPIITGQMTLIIPQLNNVNTGGIVS